MNKVRLILIVFICLILTSCSSFHPNLYQEKSRLDVLTEYDPLSLVTCDHDDYTVLVKENEVNIEKLGNYPIIYTVTDGKHSEEFTFSFSVVDRVKPELKLIKPYQIETGTIFADVFNPEEHFLATDNLDGDLTGQIRYTGVVDTSVAGLREITVTVSDSSSNTTSMTVTVSVNGLAVEMPDNNDDQEASVSAVYCGPEDSILTLFADSSFRLKANTCSGFTVYTGTYQSDSTKVRLYLDYLLDESDPSSRNLEFEKNGTKLIYRSSFDLCAPAHEQVYTKE